MGQIEMRPYKNVSKSPCMGKAISSYARLVESGHSLPAIGFSNRDPCIVATEDGEVLGAIIYVIDALENFWIQFSFVDADHRGRGIYALMFAELERMARDAGAKRIGSHVSVNNHAQISASAKVGMLPLHYRMNKEL